MDKNGFKSIFIEILQIYWINTKSQYFLREKRK